MKALSIIEAFALLCELTGKWGLYVAITGPVEEELSQVVFAAPYLTWSSHAQIIVDGGGILLFDTEEEMQRHFEMTVGDDGPTELNKYDGPTRVYALGCAPDGKLQSENT